MDLKVINARSVDVAIIDLVEKEQYDLLVMGTTMSKGGTAKGFGGVVERILKNATCPVWLCFSAPHSPFKKTAAATSE